MKFATFHLFECPQEVPFDVCINNEIEQMVAAEELGFDSVWITEHHFNYYGVCGDPLVVAAAVAGQTKRIRIGTAVSLLPFANPVRLAEQVALVDNMSRGRFDLGVGRGYQPNEFEGFGIPLDESRTRFEECLDILQQAWTQDKFSYKGKMYQYDNVRVLPKPYQKPHPPVLIGTSGTPESVTNAARRGLRLMAGALIAGRERITATLELYRKTRLAEGHDPARVDQDLALAAFNLRTHVAETTEQARANVAGPLQWFVDNFVNLAVATPKDGREPESYKVSRDVYRAHQKPLDAYFDADLYGDPETCVRRLKELQGMGIQFINCWFSFGGMKQSLALKTMEMFSKEVMPRLR